MSSRAASRRLLLACALALMIGSDGAAQPEPEAGPLPSGDGQVRVRVVRTGGSGAEGLDVVLYALPSDGAPGLARASSDAEGRVVFEGVAPDPEIAYLVGVRAEGVPYGERIAFEAGRKELDVEVEVAQTDTELSLAGIGAGVIRIDRDCEALSALESHPISNATDRVLWIPPEQREGREPVLVHELPLQAGPLSNALGVLPQGLERDGRTLRFWGPVYPGGQELEFGYGLPSRETESPLQWRFPRGAADVTWIAPEDGGELRAAGLTKTPSRSLAGVAYAGLQGRDLAPGATVDLRLRVAEPETPPVRVTQSRVFIELDDALLEASERHEIEIEGEAPLGPAAAPLLCLTLPRDAEGLRFDSATLAMGLSTGSRGTVAIHGPIPAGSSALVFSYQLPLAGETAVFARRFPLDVPLLDVFVTDTGVRPRTERLHRLRPIRNANRNYLHLQGFGVSRDEEVRVELERLPAPRSLPRMAAVGFGLLAAGATFAFLMGPLQGTRPEEDGVPSRVDELAAEREAVYSVIRDLDDDYETGKLLEEDYQAMRAEQRSRAVALLAQERAAGQAPAAEAAAEERSGCPECGEALPAQARFCPQCGAKTGAANA